MLGLFFFLFLSANARILSQIKILPPEQDYYILKEHIVLTSDIFGDDYDPVWPFDVKPMKMGEEKKAVDLKYGEKNTAEQIDYDYFYDKNATRSKKQLTESNNTEIEQTTSGHDLTEEYTTELEKKNGSSSYTDEYMKELERKNDTYNYTDEVDSNSILQSIDPQNCTEGVGVGLTALRCFYSTQGSQQAYILSKFLTFWFIFSLIILFLLWCTKGWCCCCCPCQFCQVDKRINETQRFLAYNPPGEWTDEKGNHHEYDPSPEEKLMYENMSRSFLII